MNKTNELIGKSGVIGEETNRLLMYLIFTSRKREHPLHIISLGNSGIGKTYLQEKVGELIPEEDKIEITTLSENALYYFGQRELQHRLVLIEDLDTCMMADLFCWEEANHRPCSYPPKLKGWMGKPCFGG